MTSGGDTTDNASGGGKDRDVISRECEVPWRCMMYPYVGDVCGQATFFFGPGMRGMLDERKRLVAPESLEVYQSTDDSAEPGKTARCIFQGCVDRCYQLLRSWPWLWACMRKSSGKKLDCSR